MSKGNAYNPHDNVRTAVEKCGCSASVFCRCAASFANVRLDTKLAETVVQACIDGVESVHQLPGAVKSFADWALMRDRKVIEERFGKLLAVRA